MNEVQTVGQQNEIITLQKRQFDALASGGFLPKGCSDKEGFARIVAGAQLGLNPIQALNGIAMINGHPTLHSDSIPCVVMASGLVTGMKYKFTGEGKELACTFYVRRKGIDEYQEWTYSMADAEQAGLLNSPTWKAHPKKMLFNRARTWCLRNTFPDVIGNLYSKDEIEDVEFSEINEKSETLKECDKNPEENYAALPLDMPNDEKKAETDQPKENADKEKPEERKDNADKKDVAST